LESQAAKTNPQSFSQESNLEFQQFDMNRVQFPQKVWQSEENLSQPSESLVFDSHTQSLSTNEGISEPVWSRMQVLGQANLTYIIAQSAHSLVLIDQHAAHERVMFEKLMNGWRKNTIETQRKLIPLTVDLRADLAEAIVGHTESLSRMGFEVELIGPETIAVSSTPSIVSESAIVRVMEKLGNDLLEQGESSAIDKVIGDLMSTMACHSVVRAGQAMSLEQMKSILIQMDEFPLSSFCPHGRPVFVEYRFHELDKAFGRIV
jgi:DNA mismatch repair protein MutL